MTYRELLKMVLQVQDLDAEASIRLAIYKDGEIVDELCPDVDDFEPDNEYPFIIASMNLRSSERD